MNKLKFSDYKDKIIKKLKEEENYEKFGIYEKVSLLPSFINPSVYDELAGNFVFGGPTIPMIALVGKESGRVYFFSLKFLFPELE